MSTDQVLRKKILDLVGELTSIEHAPKKFEAGKSWIAASGRVYGADDLKTLVDASLDFWLTTGRFNTEFEAKLRQYLSASHVLTVNSGSSANLLAVAALTSPLLGARALQPGDEVITVAACFPTTVNPLLLYGLTPVFVDIDIPTYNAQAELIAKAVTKKTKAIVLAHSLGNPFDLDRVMEIAAKHKLWVIEDCCDALGAKWRGKRVGTFGHVGTLSFYPAHQITTGEGGAVFTNDATLKKVLESHRDWGRDCWCDPGKENTCGKRFDWQLGDLPKGYDHKYTYSHLGYNMKMTDMQAAVGCAQMAHVDEFIQARRRHFDYLHAKLQSMEEVLTLPEATPGSEPSWFGFPVTLRAGGPKRVDVLKALKSAQIDTRLLFAGNITRQPYFKGRKFQVAGSLENTDLVAENTFWLGVYPGLTEPMLDYMAETLKKICSR